MGMWRLTEEYRHQLLTLEDFQFRRADNHPDMPSVNLKVKDLRSLHE